MQTFRSLYSSDPSAFGSDYDFAEDSQAVLDVLDNFNLDPSLFAGNLQYLSGPAISINREPDLPHSPTIVKFKFKHDRPHFPIWSIAALPDVMDWFNTQMEEAEISGQHAKALKHLGITSDDPTPEELKRVTNSTGHFNAAAFKTLIYNYIRATGRFPELARPKRGPACGCLVLVIVGVGVIFLLGYCAGHH